MKLQLAISNVVKRSQMWDLPLVKDEIRVSHIVRSHMKADYLIGDHQISHANEVWNLGFLVNENLDFEEY